MFNFALSVCAASTVSVCEVIHQLLNLHVLCYRYSNLAKMKKTKTHKFESNFRGVRGDKKPNVFNDIQTTHT